MTKLSKWPKRYMLGLRLISTPRREKGIHISLPNVECNTFLLIQMAVASFTIPHSLYVDLCSWLEKLRVSSNVTDPCPQKIKENK
jgi:hypothetical protein